MAGSEFQQEILFAFGGGDPGIRVAILDGPVDRTHDCFVGARLTPLETEIARQCDDDVHATAQGTHLSSLIFGQPCSSIEGLAPLCRGLITPVFSDAQPICQPHHLAEAMTVALGHGAHVILIGGTWFAQPTQRSSELIEAVARCNADNVLIVAAAGRHGASGLLQQCGATILLPVGAIDPRGEMFGRGDHRLRDLGVVVPACNVWGATLEGRTTRRSSANVAAALVAGIAGLLLGVQRRSGQTPDPRSVVEAIRTTARPRMASNASECQRLWMGRDSFAAAAAYLIGRYEEAYASSLFSEWCRSRLRASPTDHVSSRPRA